MGKWRRADKHEEAGRSQGAALVVCLCFGRERPDMKNKLVSYETPPLKRFSGKSRRAPELCMEGAEERIRNRAGVVAEGQLTQIS